MVTVLRQEGWSVVIYKDDHPPAHVHVFGQGGSLKINLAAAGNDPALMKSTRLSTHDIRRALALVEAQQDFLIRRWEEIHGPV